MVAGGDFGCSSSSTASVSAEGRSREARGVSPAGVAQRIRSRRSWRVDLEVQQTKDGAVSVLGLGLLRRLLRRRQRWTSTAGVLFLQEDPRCFPFCCFVGFSLLLLLTGALSGQFQKLYACCNPFVSI